MNILEVKGLTKSFGGIKAVDNLSFSLRKGSITSIIGPNGAGKTTVFNLITSNLYPDNGFIYYNGKTISKFSPHRAAVLGIGRLFQDVRVFNKLTALENILVSIKNNYGENPLTSLIFRKKVRKAEEDKKVKAIKWLEFVGLLEKEDSLAENLSFGQQKLLSLARILANEADLLLMDEPISGIHPDIVDKVLTLIKRLAKEGKTILLIEHNIGVVLSVSDWVMLLDEGKLVAFGLPSEIREDKKLRETYLGR